MRSLFYKVAVDVARERRAEQGRDSLKHLTVRVAPHCVMASREGRSMRRNARVVYDCKVCGAKAIYSELLRDTNKLENELLERVSREAVCVNFSWKMGKPCPWYGKPQEVKAIRIEWE